MKADLQALARAGWLRRVDAALGEWIARAFPESAPEVALAAALAARAVDEGHSALRLDAAQAWLASLDGRGEIPTLPDPETWRASLRASTAVRGASSSGANEPAPRKPLVLDDQGRVYLRRYFEYERQLAQTLVARSLSSPLPQVAPSLGGEAARSAERAALVRGRGNPYYVDPDHADPSTASTSGATDAIGQARPHPAPDPGQQGAADIALTRRFALVTGGPGTGKTQGVVRMLAELADEAHARSRPLRIALAAPTGKAAARLAESVRTQLPELALPDAVAAMVPREAFTLHRLLGLSPARPRAKFHREAPLPFDVVVVDEVSMVDLPMMRRLVDAAREDAMLVLLGDPDQLAAVEAGDVLGALVEAAREPPLSRCHTHLTQSRRFAEHGALGRLANAITRGDAEAALAACKDRDELRLHAGDAHGTRLIEHAVAAYRAILDVSDAGAALRAANRFRVLTALRHGPAGNLALDRTIEQHLKRHAGVRADASWWRGRLLMVTVNCAGLGLFNGDIGVVWPDADGEPKIWFAADGAPRAVSSAALPPHEGAFALTVHKAQGSEFERVALVTGPDSAVLTRELLYTGVTRARSGITLYSTPETLQRGIANRTFRMSGLADRLREAAAAAPIAESLPDIT